MRKNIQIVLVEKEIYDFSNIPRHYDDNIISYIDSVMIIKEKKNNK